VLVITRLLFRDGIQLNGLPASPTGPHRRLFALPPCWSAVSTIPIRHPQRLSTYHRPLAEWAFRFCSGAKTLVSSPCGRCSSVWWAEFPQTLAHSKAVRQLTSPYNRWKWQSIRILACRVESVMETL